MIFTFFFSQLHVHDESKLIVNSSERNATPIKRSRVNACRK